MLNQIARRRFVSAAQLSWALAAVLSLCSPELSAQTPPGGTPPVDTARSALVGATASAPADPLRGNPATMSSLGSQARSVQDGFERNHRTGLRFYNGGADASCEVQLGRICYWNNNGDVPPPAERNDAKLEREQLLDILSQAQAADPNDDWVNGMRVRYAIESEQRDVAIGAARACKGTPWWCEALEGLALHNANQHKNATAAFMRALTLMPVAQQCTWTDLTWWLDPAMHAAYKATLCANRGAENVRVLRLAQPLWMLPSNDLQNELYARHTMSRVHSLARIPYDLQWGDDLLESQIRYGWPTAWSVQNGGVADPRPPSVIGHEPTPSYDFMPVPSAIATPLAATPGDWNPRRQKARMRYAPRYASGFGALPNQFARFLRGDTTIVAGGYRLMRELEMGRAPYTAALTGDAFDGREPLQAKRESALANGALLLPIRTPMLASLEVLAPIGKRAARVRTMITPLPAGTRLSEYLLLQRGDVSATPMLERNALQAYGSNEIEAGTSIGIYWEMYRPASPGQPLQVSLRATRVGAGFFQKLGSSIGLSKSVTPISIKYNDNGRPDGGAGRSLNINFPQVPAGDYQLTLIVSGVGITDSTTQVIRVKGGK